MNDKMKPVRARFAPSPTGHLHLGGARTALYDFLLARQTGGQFILRIEDSDQRRLVPGSEQELMKSLRWLGIDWDEGPDKGGPYAPYRQSERKAIYQDYARQLIAMDKAFYCFCSPQRLAQVRQEQMSRKESTHYDGTCRRLDPAEAARRVAAGESHVIRFKTPKEGSTTAVDLIRGPITVENRELDDYIIVRSDGLALYHLAAMVDDYLMKITHVIRGSEWLPTFPLHVMIVRAFGWDEPVWVHLSVFLNPDGKGKLSKRTKTDTMKDGWSTYIKDLQDLGYVPEAVVNWIALMGWSYDDRTELFSMGDLLEKFSLEKLNPAPAAINFTKLDHFNGLYIRALPLEELARRIKPFLESAGLVVDDARLLAAMPITQERLGSLDEAPAMIGFFFQTEVEYDPQTLIAKGLTAEQSVEVLRQSLAVLSSLPDIEHATVEAPLRALVETLGFSAGQVFGILRVAVTGQKISPPLFESMAIIGRETVLQRIKKALFMLENLEK